MIAALRTNLASLLRKTPDPSFKKRRQLLFPCNPRVGMNRIAISSVIKGESEGSSAAEEGTRHVYEIKKEELKYSRYIQVFNRVVEHSVLPEGSQEASTIEYDVVGARTKSCRFVAVVPFNSTTKTFTLLSEYAQGANAFVYGVPCGGLSEKHTSLEHCAEMELSEEAYLKDGTLIRLLPDTHPGLLEVKWCKNRFVPFLVIDPKVDPTPHPRDKEEFINLHQVDLGTLKSLMYGGDMMLPSIVSCAMAIEYLEKHNLL